MGGTSMGYVYILTNYNKTVLYTGVTNNLQRRLYEHRMGINDSFTKLLFLITAADSSLRSE